MSISSKPSACYKPLSWRIEDPSHPVIPGLLLATLGPCFAPALFRRSLLAALAPLPAAALAPAPEAQSAGLPQLGPCLTVSFLRKGKFPYENRRPEKSWYPNSNLSTGGSRCAVRLLRVAPVEGFCSTLPPPHQTPVNS